MRLPGVIFIGNLRDYGGGKTLLTDWLASLLGKYSAYYSVPLLDPGPQPDPYMQSLSQVASAHSSHFKQLAAGVDAVYDRTANKVTLTSPERGMVIVTGARTEGFSIYGSDVSAPITLNLSPVTFAPTLRP